MYLWTSVDVDSKKILGAYIFNARSGLDTHSSSKYSLKLCKNKPFFIGDKAPWFKWALQSLGLQYKHETFGDRNAVEQWYFPFKYRVKRFWKYFPYHSSNAPILGWCLSYVILPKIWRCLF